MYKLKSILLGIVKSHIPAHMLVAASAWISRVVIALIQIAVVRILLDSLGLESYAVFMLLVGLVGWFTLGDMGIGVSIQNYISESRAANQPYEALLATGSIFAILLLFVMSVALYFISLYVGPLFLGQFSFLSEVHRKELFFITGALFIS